MFLSGARWATRSSWPPASQPGSPDLMLGVRHRVRRRRAAPRHARPRRHEPGPRLRRGAACSASRRRSRRRLPRRSPSAGRCGEPGRWSQRGPALPGARSAANRARPAGDASPLDRPRPHRRRRRCRPSLHGLADLLLRPDAGPADLPPGARVTDTTIARRATRRRRRPTTAVTGAAPPRPQRPAGRGGHRRRGVPPPARMGAGWVPRGRPLLRPLRLPDHHAPARGVGRTGRINLAAFWGRRARRLLPALFLVVAALGALPHLQRALRRPRCQRADRPPGLRGDAIATLLYVNNWHLIYAHQSYFAQFSTPSPLAAHLVAGDRGAVLPGLAPRAAAAVPLRPARLARRRRRRSPSRSACVLVALLHGASCSTPGSTRRGSTTAPTPGCSTSWPAPPSPSWRRRGRQPNARARRTLHVVGPVAAVVLGVFWVRAGTPGGLPTNFMFEGGFLLCAALAALVVADARLDRAGLVRPRRWPGRRCTSSGPSPTASICGTGRSSSTSPRPAPGCRRCRSTSCASPSPWRVSTASYYLVERPIRLARPARRRALVGRTACRRPHARS